MRSKAPLLNGYNHFKVVLVLQCLNSCESGVARYNDGNNTLDSIVGSTLVVV